jgi:hypothetical protein
MYTHLADPKGIESILRSKARKDVIYLLMFIGLIPLIVAPFFWSSIPYLWRSPPTIKSTSSGAIKSEFIKIKPNKTELLSLGNIEGSGGHTYHAYCWQRSKDIIVVLSYKAITLDAPELIVNRDRDLAKNADLKQLVKDSCRATKNELSRVGYVTTPLDSTIIFVAVSIFSILAILIIPASAAPMFVTSLFWHRCLITRSKETAFHDFQNRWGPKLKKMLFEGQYRQYGRSILMVSDEMIVLSGFGECWFIEKSAINRITTAVIPVLKFKLTYLRLKLYDDRVIWAQMSYRLVTELKSAGVKIDKNT